MPHLCVLGCVCQTTGWHGQDLCVTRSSAGNCVSAHLTERGFRPHSILNHLFKDVVCTRGLQKENMHEGGGTMQELQYLQQNKHFLLKID